MNNYLAVDTSSRYLSVVAKKGERVASRYIPDCALNHSVMLMGEVDAVLSELDLKPAECDFFCAVTGPGSFTGIRIGIATAKGFALGANKPLKSVTSFDTVAYNICEGEFAVVIDAAHGHFYVCGYNGGEISFQPCYMSKDEVLNLGLPLFGFEALDLPNYTKVENNLQTAVERSTLPLSNQMVALYVRKSQAEEGRK